MAGPGLPWTEILPSRERANWLRAAAVACLLAAAALATALPRAPGVAPALAIGLLLAGAVLAWRGAGWPAPRFQVRIDADGAIWLRPSVPADGAAVGARPRHVSGRLVTLAIPGRTIALWPDSLPQAGFRRLAAHARWHIDRTAPADRSAPRRA